MSVEVQKQMNPWLSGGSNVLGDNLVSFFSLKSV